MAHGQDDHQDEHGRHGAYGVERPRRAPRARLRRGTSHALLALLLLLPLAQASGEEPKATAEWKDAAGAVGLTAGAIGALERDGFVIAGNPDQQAFEAYIDMRAKLPVFVTSDSLLNGYHVLLEESLLRLESVRTRLLPAALTRIAQALPAAALEVKGPADLVAAGQRRATLTLAVALALLGEELPGLATEDHALVRAQVAHIEAGEGRGKPPWLGPPDPGFLALDYGQFRPCGIHGRLPGLQRSFRARAWLQAIPLRLSVEVDVAAATLLHAAREGAWPDLQDDERVAALFSYGGLLPSNTVSTLWLDRYVAVPDDLEAETLAKFRTEKAAELGVTAVNDMVASQPLGPSWRIVPWMRSFPPILSAGLTARKYQRRNLSLRSLFSTCSSSSKSSQTISPGRFPLHFRPRIFCPDPRAKIRN